jgi:hypothetical protein
MVEIQIQFGLIYGVIGRGVLLPFLGIVNSGWGYWVGYADGIGNWEQWEQAVG